MSIQYVLGTYLILGGIATIVVGPDVAGENPDGSNGPVPPHERLWVRLFGAGCVACGTFVLVASLLGFRAPLSTEPPIP